MAMDPRWTPWIATAIVISIVGVIVNCLSLSYFIRKQNKGLGDRLLMLLNICDLLVCAMYMPYALSSYFEDQMITFIICFSIFDLFFQCTVFATSLISVTRAIKVVRPFFSIRGSWVAASFCLFCLCETAIQITYSYCNNLIFSCRYVVDYIPMSISSMITLNVITVFISTMITAYRLMKSKVQGTISESNRHATVTILILSTTFCLFNLSVILYLVLSSLVYFGIIDRDETIINLLNVLRYITITMMCANSAVNPIIYLTRKEEMRRHVSETCRTLVEWFRTRSRVIGLNDIGSQNNRPQESNVGLAMSNLNAHNPHLYIENCPDIIPHISTNL